MYIRFLATVGLLFVSGMELLSQEKYSLRPHWEIGQKYEYQTDLAMLMKLKALGDEAQETRISQDSEFVVSQEGKLRLVDQQFTSIKGSVNLYGQVLEFDSQELAKAPPLLQQLFGSILEKKLTLVFDENDQFVEVKGKELEQPAPLGQGTGLSPRSLADQIRAAFELAVPQQEVAVGESWPILQKQSLPPIGEIQIRGNAKFEGLEEVQGEKMAKITVTGVMELPKIEASTPAMMSLNSQASRFNSEVLFRVKDRALYHSKTQVSIAMDFTGNQAQVHQEVVNQLKKKSSAKP